MVSSLSHKNEYLTHFSQTRCLVNILSIKLHFPNIQIRRKQTWSPASIADSNRAAKGPGKIVISNVLTMPHVDVNEWTYHFKQLALLVICYHWSSAFCHGSGQFPTIFPVFPLLPCRSRSVVLFLWVCVILGVALLALQSCLKSAHHLSQCVQQPHRFISLQYIWHYLFTRSSPDRWIHFSGSVHFRPCLELFTSWLCY